MATLYDIETALDYILNAQYGKDVRQAIHDAIHACFDEGGSGSIDLSAREGIQDLTLEVESALAEMNLHSGRTKLIDSETIATANSTITLPKAFSDFDSLWIHIADIPASSAGAKLKIGSYTVDTYAPKWSDQVSSVDIKIDAITANSAIVKMVGTPRTVNVGGGFTQSDLYYIDEFPLQPKDASGNALNMNVRTFSVTNCTGASISAVGYGDKGSSGTTSTGLVLDSNGVVHFV